LLCRTKGRQITTDSQGKITGILATREGAGELTIRAKSIILATGGYGGNKQLLKKYHPNYNENVLITYPIRCMGDGLTMAIEVGADTIGMGKLCMETKSFKGSQPRQMLVLSCLPESIWLDKKGQRFVDEATYITRGAGGWNVSAQLYRLYRDYTNYTLFDEGILQHLLDTQAGADHYRNLKREAHNTSNKELEDIIQQAVEKGHLKIADSLDEAARWMGIVPADLKATVDEYNSSCDDKRDSFLAKDPEYLLPLRNPPYYIIKCTASFLNPMGGVKINHKMEALDIDGNPIPGVYATGIDTGGWEGDASYNILLNGTFFSFAINSGRIAGENATKYVLQ
jgi:fumarate reductase flavoprotein subunit